MIGKRAVLAIIAILQLLQFFATARCQCPEVFRTYINATTGDRIGLIKISKPPRGVLLRIRVVLSIPMALSPIYRGRLDLANTLEDSVRALAEEKPLYYKLQFPVQNPIPIVTSITFNDQVYCIGPSAVGYVKTSVVLEHSMNQPETIDLITKKWLDEIRNLSSKKRSSIEEVQNAKNNDSSKEESQKIVAAPFKSHSDDYSEEMDVYYETSAEVEDLETGSVTATEPWPENATEVTTLETTHSEPDATTEDSSATTLEYETTHAEAGAIPDSTTEPEPQSDYETTHTEAGAITDSTTEAQPSTTEVTSVTKPDFEEE